MGLDTSHDAYHGSYTGFNRFRNMLAILADINLHEMQGYTTEGKAWEDLPPDAIHILLNHSDCDGIIEAMDCKPLADRMQELLMLIPENDPDFRVATERFIKGLRLADSKGEDVDFH
jgi:hypothetical protein